MRQDVLPHVPSGREARHFVRRCHVSIFFFSFQNDVISAPGKTSEPITSPAFPEQKFNGCNKRRFQSMNANALVISYQWYVDRFICPENWIFYHRKFCPPHFCAYFASDEYSVEPELLFCVCVLTAAQSVVSIFSAAAGLMNRKKSVCGRRKTSRAAISAARIDPIRSSRSFASLLCACTRAAAVKAQDTLRTNGFKSILH